jgi:hypothetical protein
VPVVSTSLTFSSTVRLRDCKRLWLTVTALTSASFTAYNFSLPDVDQASIADINFQQCCLWLKEIGSSWAPASSHRLFFEGCKCCHARSCKEMSPDLTFLTVIKGGRELAATRAQSVGANQFAGEQSHPLDVPTFWPTETKHERDGGIHVAVLSRTIVLHHLRNASNLLREGSKG